MDIERKDSIPKPDFLINDLQDNQAPCKYYANRSINVDTLYLSVFAGPISLASAYGSCLDFQHSKFPVLYGVMAISDYFIVANKKLPSDVKGT